MKLTAYTLYGEWDSWEGVSVWILQGPQLRIWFASGKSSRVVDLPAEVIGLADDSPPRPPDDRKPFRGSSVSPGLTEAAERAIKNYGNARAPRTDREFRQRQRVQE